MIITKRLKIASTRNKEWQFFVFINKTKKFLRKENDKID